MYTKISFLSILMVLAITFSSCKKDKKKDDVPNPTTTDQTYSSMVDFYNKNGAKLQTYQINASTGGSFTSPKGTVVTIPANCFVDASDNNVSGTVTIQFKDIYSKSDMLLSDIGTTFFDGAPMVSGGEFFINALLGDSALQIDAGKFIAIEQPFNNGAVKDLDMEAMILNDPRDTIQGGGNIEGWSISPGNSLLYTATSYVFNLYAFSGTNGAGTWCNSDNPYYFQAYTNTTLTVNAVAGYTLDVFLVFKNVNSMVHVYSDGTNYPYAYSPVGLECTVVVLAVKDDKLYSSFTPVTITSNLTINPSLTETTTDAFKTVLNSLN